MSAVGPDEEEPDTRPPAAQRVSEGVSRPDSICETMLGVRPAFSAELALLQLALARAAP